METIEYFYTHPLIPIPPTTQQSPNDDEIRSTQPSNLTVSNFNTPKYDHEHDKNVTRYQICLKRKNSESTLDEKIEAIIKSTRKKAKNVKKTTPVCKRKRKSKDQLRILNEKLCTNDLVPNEKLNEIANEIGLTKIQVYKWYWDNKIKKLNEE